jgi:hypothetical protein
LIKNAGVALAILTAIFTYIGYTISSNAILGYVTFSFFVMVVLFSVLNIVAIKIIKKPPQDKKSKWQPINPKAAFNLLSNGLTGQIIQPLFSLMVIIYFSLFLLHAIGAAYSSVGLHLSTVFTLTGLWYIDFMYALSVLASAICIVISLRKDPQLSFFAYMVTTALILVIAFLFVGYNLIVGYSGWFSYQLWLTVIIEFLLYFALIQYRYATNARLRIDKYKNGLNIVRTKAEYLLSNMSAGCVTRKLYSTCAALETEYKQLEKPKLVIAEVLPFVLQGYVTIDMSEEVKALEQQNVTGEHP